MTRPLARATAAELVKLAGLPAVLATVLATVAAGAALSAALAWSQPGSVDAMQVTTQAIVFLQVGLVLVGVLAAGTEYAGRQIATTLTATPNRLRLLAGKTAAYLATAAATSLATVVVATTTAWVVLGARGLRSTRGLDVRPLLGAAGYLVLVGLLALALAGLLRSLVPSLVTMLALLLIASPLLAAATEHARWLPDRAGSQLYLPHDDPALTPATGALVLLGWVTATALAAALAFHYRDA